MKDENKDSGSSLIQNLSQFLTEKKGLMAIIGGLIIATVVVVLVMGSLQTGKNEASALLAEEIQKNFQEWSIDQENVEKKDAFMSLIDQGLESKGDYAVQRSLFARGHYFALNEQYVEAAGDFYQLVEQFPDSYMAVVSLYNAATSMENGGNLDKAIEYLEKLVNDYADIAPEVPEALFNLGRLYEEKGDKDTAKTYYDKLVLDFSSSDWTNLAKSRIISLSL